MGDMSRLDSPYDTVHPAQIDAGGVTPMEPDGDRRRGLTGQLASGSRRPHRSPAVDDLRHDAGVKGEMGGDAPTGSPPRVQLTAMGDQFALAVERPGLIDRHTDPLGQPLEK